MQALRAADGLVKVGMGMSTGVAGTALDQFHQIDRPLRKQIYFIRLLEPTQLEQRRMLGEAKAERGQR